MSMRNLRLGIKDMAKAKAKNNKELQKKAKVLMKAKAMTRTQNKSSSLAIWQSTIEELKQNQFADLDQAIHAIADRVIERLGKKDSAAEKEFLITLLKTDPGVATKLRQMLLIKE